MSLSAEIQTRGGSLVGRQASATCTVRMVLDLLGEDDHAALQSLLDNRRVFGTTIAEVLNDWGPKVSELAQEHSGDERERLEHLAELCAGMASCTVQRHRRGGCKCGRSLI